MTVVGVALVTVLVAAAACVQGAAGFGMALLAAPLLTLVDRSFAPAPLVLAVLPLSLLVAQRDWAHLDRGGLVWAIGGRLPGVVLGAVAAAALSEHTLALVLGVAVLVAVGLSMVTARLRPTPGTLVSAGFASGFMGTTTSVGGPPMALVYQRSDGPAFRSTLAIYFAAGAVMSLTAVGHRRPGRRTRAAPRAPPVAGRHRRLPALQAADPVPGRRAHSHDGPRGVRAGRAAPDRGGSAVTRP